MLDYNILLTLIYNSLLEEYGYDWTTFWRIVGPPPLFNLAPGTAWHDAPLGIKTPGG